MTTVSSNGKAVTIKRTFSRETTVSIDINSDKSIIWALLTNASDYSRWNSTMISMDGTIVKGDKIKLKAKLDPDREFRLTVKEFEVERRLVWGDAMGTRIFTIQPLGNQLTRFSMTEKIGGPFFPLFAKMIPSFDEAFEQFANDLKREAEIISKTK